MISNFTETLVDQFGTKINYGTSEIGSGVTISYRGQLSQYIGTMGHEHGHQTFMPGHITYSRNSYGLGFDNFFSPYDMILNDYMQPRDVTINSTNVLGDYSSRNTTNGEVLKIPIQGNEFFLLASRNKVSKWDRNMLGDTAQIDTYNDNSEYGKGLYIYHIPNGIDFPCNNCDISPQDMECADGLFEWEYAGLSAQQVIFDCFISDPNHWKYYKKKKVIYDNDVSTLGNSNGKGDGISLRYNGTDVKWWGEGKQPTDNCSIGTERIFTNLKDIYIIRNRWRQVGCMETWLQRSLFSIFIS